MKMIIVLQLHESLAPVTAEFKSKLKKTRVYKFKIPKELAEWRLFFQHTMVMWIFLLIVLTKDWFFVAYFFILENSSLVKEFQSS